MKWNIKIKSILKQATIQYTDLTSQFPHSFCQIGSRVTCQKLEVCTQWNVPVKHFKICYISFIKKPCSFFPFSFHTTLYFCRNNALVYVDIDQGIHTDIFNNKKIQNSTISAIFLLHFILHVEGTLMLVPVDNSAIYWSTR